MTNKAKIGLEILVTAVIIGLAADALLREVPWGLNAFVFLLIFIAALTFLSLRHRPEVITAPALALKSAIIFFAVMFLIRDAVELKVFDTFAIVFLLGVLILRTFPVNIFRAGVSHYIAALLWAGMNSIFAPFLLIGSDINHRELATTRWMATTYAVARGLVIVSPLVLVFGLLFMSADAAFDDFVRWIIAFKFETIVSHIAITSVFAVLTASYFRGTLLQPFARWRSTGQAKADSSDTAADEPCSDRSPRNKDEMENSAFAKGESVFEHIRLAEISPKVSGNEQTYSNRDIPVAAKLRRFDFQDFNNSILPQSFTLGTIETGVIFGLINVLFLSFVVFQIPYLFGGLEFVQTTPNLKLADFARRGFGELVFASVLVLPILLCGHWLLRKGSAVTANLFKVLAIIQIGLLFVVMASAMRRILLLTSELGYGWTPTRFYPIVLMFWLGVVFLWFIVTVLFGDRRHFAWGSLWFTIIILGATNLFNPDAFIAENNLQLMRLGRQFDAHTNASLGSEAVPILLQALPEMTHNDQCIVKWALHKRLINMSEESDFRIWNWQRQKALKALKTAHNAPDQHDRCPSWMSFDENSKIVPENSSL